MKEFTCIVCPNGCHLVYDEKTGECKGNKCPRGLRYAINECTNPTRSLTTSVKTSVKGYPVISVRTDGEIKKELINEAMEALKNVVIDKPMPINSVVIENILNSGVNIITTAPIEGEDNNE